jgi:hypothetical protein
MDCETRAKYACQYNPDFLGYHRLEDLVLDTSVDVSGVPSMTLTTCLSLCQATVVPSEVAVLRGQRCICSKGNTLICGFNNLVVHLAE